MPEITFVFGPNDSFFFDCPKTWKFHNIPTTLRQLFNSSMGPAWRIAQPYCLALAPQNKSPEPIWYIGCKTLSGEDKIFYSQDYFDINYPDLSRWIKTIPNGPQACYVTFGAGYSYFASALGRGSVWAGIPSDMSDRIQKIQLTPSCVSLGKDNAWFAMWPDGTFDWNFHGRYSGLDKLLKAAAPGSVSYLAISPYHKEHYFISYQDRTIKYNFTHAPREWMHQMQDVFQQWQAEIAQGQAPPQQGFAPQQAFQHGPPPATQYAMYNPNLQPPPQHMQAGFMSPQTPNTPMSHQSNYTSPPMSPQPPALYAQYAQPVQVAPVFEMMGDLPAVPARPQADVTPVHLQTTPAPSILSGHEKKRKFLSKIFS